MKSRVIITTVVSFLLLFATIGAGLNAVFTVTLIDSDFTVCSEAGRRDAEALKAELDEFVGSSTTFLDLEAVKEKVSGYPCFRVENVEKQFPKTVKVQVTERKEFYAIPNGDNYAILDEEGYYLYDGENTNRSGGNNIVLEGFESELTLGEQATGGYFEQIYEMFSVFSELLGGGVRANVVSLSLVSGGGQVIPEHMLFVVTMREGVKIAIRNPSEGIAVKARAAFTDEEFGYLSPNFSDKRRMYGAITVGNLSSDGASANVSFFDELPF